MKVPVIAVVYEVFREGATDGGVMANLSGVLEKALAAARRGDVPSLEVELRNLRRPPVYGRGSIALVLRSMARSAALHPSGKAELGSKAS